MHAFPDSDDDHGLIQPSLITQLKAILDQYPDDGQIFKELIQNAEDAGATEVTFLYDQHTYGHDKIHQPSLVDHQGPALLAYNNAGFTKEDWTGIRRLYDSIKEKDPLKVGRFGLGFKSVFHLTDLPSILSGQKLLILDPHENFLNDKCRPTSGKCWNMKKDGRCLTNLSDQFRPYLDQFGCTKDSLKSGTFSGTLLRFPLRQQPSEISSTKYDKKRMEKLFECFETDAHLIPLFLKKVEKISLCSWEKQDKSEKLLFVVQVAPSCISTVRQKRAEFIKELKQAKMQNDHISTTYKLSIETIKGSKKMTFHYLVRECYACGEVSTTFSNLRQELASSYKPMVGVAMLLTNPTDGEIVPEGQTFCVLPLSKEERSSSGLPVHVNGYFSVGQNRRDLKWKTSGQREDSDKDVAWNLCLLNEVLPQCYAGLITDAIALKEGGHEEVSTADVYAAIPDVRQVHDKWKMMLDAVFRLLIQQRMLYTEACNGRWVSLRDSYFSSQEETEANIVVKELLLSVEYNVVTPPAHIKCIVDQFSHSIVTPQLVREALKWHPDSYTGRGEGWKLALLEFVLQDKNFDEIEGINLLPVDDGTFKAFGSGQNEHIYIPSHAALRDLLPGLESKLMRTNIDARLEERLKGVAMHGKSRLKKLEKTHIPKLIRDVLPAKWHNKVEVCYNPDEDEGPPRDWFEILWKHMATYHPNDLGDFEGLTLLPVADTMTMQLIGLHQGYPKAIMVENNGAKLSPTLCKLMVNLGVHLVDDVPRYVKNHPSVVGRYIKLPTAQHVTDILLFASQRDGIQAVASTLKANFGTADDLINLLSREPSSFKGSASKKQLLQKLPLFETTLSTSAQRDYASVHEVAEGVADHHFPVQLPCRLLLVPDERHQTVSKALCAKVLTLSALVRDYLIPRIKQKFIPVSHIVELTMHVLENIHMLAQEDSQVYSHFRDVAFVETMSGTLVEPCNLYSPDCATCQSLFGGAKGAFPFDAYARKDLLTALSKMGLKTKQDLDAGDLKTAMSSLVSTPSERKSTKAGAILDVLNSAPHLLQQHIADGNQLVAYAQNLAWVPVAETRPLSYPSSLEWAGTSKVCKPADVVTSPWTRLVGSAKAVVMGEVSPALEKGLGWDRIPSVASVLAQLEAVVQKYRPDEKDRYLGIILEIYRHLQSRPRADVAGIFGPYSSWVWVGDAFTSPDSVVFQNSVMALQPYLYVLPREMEEFQDFFSNMGVKVDVDSTMLVNALQKIKAKHDGSSSYANSEVRKDLQMTIHILNHVRNHVNSMDLTTREKILLPVHCQDDNRLVLLPVEDCTYIDTEWIRQGYDLATPVDEEEEIRLTHGDLPPETAQLLEVPTLINRVLHADELQLQAFGQSESLTNRISSLLGDYTDGLSIIKEVVQNADDAGATTVKFMYDERSNEDAVTSLLDPGMRETQGPAFWVYNDAVFTEDDFSNIISLGHTSKEEALEKVGQFGLGFNAVYNLTDVPSFISHQSIVILDPHTTNLGRAIRDKSKPGIKLDIRKNRYLLSKAQDQFKPFRGVFGCDLDQTAGYSGTLFRLPLRTFRQAENNRLCTRHYDNVQMIKLLKMLEDNAHRLLLFTQHVKYIELHHLPPHGDPLQSVPIMRAERNTCKMFKELPSSGSSTHDTSGVLQFVAANADSLQGMCRLSAVVETSKLLLPGIKELLDIESQVQPKCSHWLISTVIENNKHTPETSSKKQLYQVGGVAMLLTKERDGYLPIPLSNERRQRGQVFCSMPLPVYCDLPVHINATFALHSSRRGLIQSTADDINQKKFDWNKSLMEGVLTEAYLFALEDSLEVLPQDAQVEYYTMWPSVKKMSSEDQVCTEPLGMSFYRQMPSRTNFPIICQNNTQTAFTQSVLVEEQLGKYEDMGPLILKNIKAHGQGMEPVTVPAPVFQNFKSAGQSHFLADKVYDFQRYYKEIVFPNLKDMEDKECEKHMAFAVSDSWFGTQFVEMLSSMDTSGCIGLLNALQLAHEKEPLDSSSLLVCQEILNCLAAKIHEMKLLPDDLTNDGSILYIPSDQNILMDSTKLCYSNSGDHSKGKVICVSREIRPTTVKLLGIKSREEYMLDKHSVGISFGQGENLTNALKRVLKTYPSNHEVLKELIQNADDAKATKIHFIHDRRHHPCEKIFQDSWKPLQGPALCVYNNSPFTEQDLEGIQQFGIGSKGHDPTRTGQYGIGFSSVYHLTDAPSVLTSGPDMPETLCVFDPHCQFVPGATREKPGRRFEELAALREDFRDVLNSYVFPGKHADMENATMVRLPLRDDSMIKKSEIAVTSHPPDIKEILRELSEEAAEILLFVHHLREIEIYDVSENGTLSLEHRICSEVRKEDCDVTQMDGQAMMGKKVKDASEDIASGDWVITDIPKATTVTFLDISKNRDKAQRWCVAQCIGFDHGIDIPLSVSDAISDGHLGLIPRGGVAAPVEHERTFQGRVFCFLPMPIETKLPIHVNGHFALGHENRRHLWTHNERGYQKDWNDLLCEHVISEAYLELLLALKKTTVDATNERDALKQQLGHYQSYFPKVEEPNWQILAKACYKKLEAKDVFPILRLKDRLAVGDQVEQLKVTWHSLRGKDLFFPESVEPSGLEKAKQGGDDADEDEDPIDAQMLDRCLMRCKFGLLHVDEIIAKGCEEAGVQIQRISPIHVLHFLSKSSTQKVIGGLPASIEDTQIKDKDSLLTLLQYCKKDEDFQSKLDGLPLLLTADGKLHKFDSRNPIVVTSYTELFPACADMLLDVCMLKDIFTEISTSCNVIKNLEIDTLAVILGRELPESILHGRSDVAWPGEQKTPVAKEWVVKLWTLLDEYLQEAIQEKSEETEQPTGNVLNLDERQLEKLKKEKEEKKRMAALQRKEKILELLKPIEDCCLIPTSKESADNANTSSRYLVAIGEAPMVLDFCKGTQEENGELKNCFNALKKCDVYLLDRQMLGCHSLSLSSAVTTLADVSACLHLLHTKVTKGLLPTKMDEHGSLLKHFSNNVEILKTDQSSTEKLEALPLHQTIHQKLTALITGYRAVVVHDAGFPAIPPNGIDMITEIECVLFLEWKQVLEPLYKFLACQSISTVDFYCDFAFQQFAKLCAIDQVTHMHYVYTHGFRVKENERVQLTYAMKNTALISDSSGVLQQARYFYDQKNHVFAAFKPELAPPPATKPFTKTAWREFLIKVGLVTEVTTDLLLECARRVESEGHSPQGNTAKKSRLLMDYIFVMRCTKHQGESITKHQGESIESSTCSDENLNLLSRVRFIEPATPSVHLTDLCPTMSHVLLRGYMHLSGAVSEEHQELVWTQVHLLPEWANPMHAFLRDADKAHLRQLWEIQDKPPISTVLDHLGALAGHIASVKTEHTNASDAKLQVFRKIYKYLQEHLDEGVRLDENDSTKLAAMSEIKCILVEQNGAEVVSPSQIAMNVAQCDQIKPFLYRMPDRWLAFRGLFLKMGVAESVSAERYAHVLRSIHQTTGNRRLNTRQLHSAFKAVKGLHLATGGLPSCELYLPSVKGTLVLSTCLVHNDVPAFSTRISEFQHPLLVDLSLCGLESSVTRVAVGNLPTRNCPRSLSSMLEEVLVDSAECSVGQDGVTGQLNSRIHSEVFQKAVHQLLLHEEGMQKQRVDKEVRANTVRRLALVAVHTVNRVETVLRDRKVGEILAGSRALKPCHVDEYSSHDTSRNIYIKEGSTLSQEHLIPLAKVINQILRGSLHDSVLDLLPLLTCPEDRIIGQLQDLNVHLGGLEGAGLQSGLPCLGTAVSELGGLDRDLTGVEPGDYVVYRADDAGSLVNAIVKGTVNDGGSRGYHIDIGGGQYVVAKKESLLTFKQLIIPYHGLSPWVTHD